MGGDKKYQEFAAGPASARDMARGVRHKAKTIWVGGD